MSYYETGPRGSDLYICRVMFQGRNICPRGRELYWAAQVVVAQAPGGVGRADRAILPLVPGEMSYAYILPKERSHTYMCLRWRECSGYAHVVIGQDTWERRGCYTYSETCPKGK